MGNMIFNRRLGTAEDESDLVHSQQPGGLEKKAEYRIFKAHMYGGPMGLGDPEYRGLTKMEEDPMIPQRMRDISRTQLCLDEVKQFSECSKNEGFTMIFNCREARDVMVACQKSWLDKPEFNAGVTEEYLNERSHYRQTGKKQKRYERGTFIKRNIEVDPPLDKDGNYRPQKPVGWEESYPDGPPSWANFNYDL